MAQMGHVQDTLKKNKEERVAQDNIHEEIIEQLKKDTLWKIKDCEDIIKTRISEQKVKDSLAELEKKLTISLRETESRLQENTNTLNREAVLKLDQLQLYTDDRFKDMKTMHDMQDEELQKCSRKVDFDKLYEIVNNLKLTMEEEHAMIHRHVKDSKDKSAELIKRFELTVEKIEAKPGQIIGLGLNKTFNQSPDKKASLIDLNFTK